VKLRCHHKTALVIAFVGVSVTAWCQNPDSRANPETIASTLQSTWSMLESDLISAADAMRAEKDSFAPTSGEFKGVRTFAQQIKHVACGNFAFFNEIQGQAPPPDCEHGGPHPAKTKPELVKYLRDSFALADQVIATINMKNALAPVSGPYGGPSTKLGIAVLAVWHASDHYGQMIEYLRMNGIVPPASRPRTPQPTR